ncbi:MAG: glycerophosphodiester phosphodiesterase family protein [Allosphingosinicella sp.]
MKRKGWIGIGVAAVAVALSLTNASWIAGKPTGRLMVVAQRGIAQPLADGADPQACAAAQIQDPQGSLWIENSLASLYKSTRIGADAVEVDARRTADDRIVLFRDETLDCRTDGTGRVAEKTLAELKALDIGHGYTADGGATFPMRGRGIAAMPTLEEALRELRGVPLIVRFRGADPADADALVAEFARVGAKIDDGHGFYGDPRVLARLEQIAPGAWTFGADALGACLESYRKTGWTGVVPAACEATTVGVPTGAGFTVWGWPYRFFARMAGAGSKVLMYRAVEDGAIAGLDRPEQFDQVPRDFKGHVFVDDFGTMGPALRR